MIFVYKKWEKFCKELSKNGLYSITAKNYINAYSDERAFVLKHDVETNPKNALEMAKIEHKYGHKGSYYVQSYLLEKEDNISVLKEIQNLGHEVTYHHDVMDSNKGDIEKALVEFEENIELFQKNGFEVTTVCQHGNPVVERIGYTSNRDFFRNPKVFEKYSYIFDIMVNYPKITIKYDYYSDAGRKFNLIYDPVNNDIIKSDDKNKPYKNLDVLCDELLKSKNNFIISTHPHRWMTSSLKYIFKDLVFKTVKFIAKLFMQIPFFKKIMSKYYYLAKKI